MSALEYWLIQFLIAAAEQAIAEGQRGARYCNMQIARIEQTNPEFLREDTQ